VSHEDYEVQGSVETKLIEELSEVIKVVCKADRFGWGSFHPESYPCRNKPKKEWCDYNKENKKVMQGGFMGHTCGKPPDNYDDLISEMDDVHKAYSNLLKARSRERTCK